MAKFKPGEKARIVNADRGEKCLIGTECIVVERMSGGMLAALMINNGMVFENHPVYLCENHVGQVYFSECALAKLLPPGSDICREIARKALEGSPQEKTPCALS